MTTIHCNAQTTPTVIQKIARRAALLGARGRVYRPRDCERLILYLKDINLPKPDMYQTCMLIAFLQQLVTFGGFYDENLEFLRMEQIQIVASMNPATTVGRHQISTPFTAIVRESEIDDPDTPELTTVYASTSRSSAGCARRTRACSGRRTYERARPRAFEQRREVLGRRPPPLPVHAARHHRVGASFCLRPRAEELLDVLAYEAARLFRDRMVDADSEKSSTASSTPAAPRWNLAEPQLEYYTTHLVNAADKADAARREPRARRQSSGDLRAKALAQRQLVLYGGERDLQIKLFPRSSTTSRSSTACSRRRAATCC